MEPTRAAALLKQTREAQGMSHRELSLRARPSARDPRVWENYIAQMEKRTVAGTGKPMSDRAAQCLARALGKPAWYFLGALTEDRQDAICTTQEVTRVVVGIESHIRSMSADQWDSWVRLRGQALAKPASK